MNRMGLFGVLWLAALCASCASHTSTTVPPAAPPPASVPTDAYELREIQGWTVRVNRELSHGHQELCDRALELLRFQLYQITREVPPPAVKKLQTVVIWVELDDPLFPCMCYHPDRGWVVGHGLDARKTHGVEIANAKNFLVWVQKQPWMVFHELAHAYHHDFLPGGFENPQVLSAYNDAKQKGLYNAVLRNNGRTERAYAMNNQMEYFSECSEAFFGTNDFYPFVQVEFKLHDRRGYDTLKAAWGVGVQPTTTHAVGQ
jgi:hypothetical protein